MLFEPLIPIDFGIILLTAFILAVIASRTGQPTVIAYLVTGLVLGPVFLDVVETTEFVLLVSELGFPLLLFLVGLEMKFDAFRSILDRVGKIAAAQVITQQVLAFIVAYLLGFGVQNSFIISMCTIFGATPVVVKMLTDKDETSTLTGGLDIGVLILQDFFIILVLGFLAAGEISSVADVGVTLAKILVLGGTLGLTSFMMSKAIGRKLFRGIADEKHAFLIEGLAWAFLFISLADIMGLSLEIGGFLAGLSIGQLPYSIELREKVRPLTNLLFAVFFAEIGLSLSAGELFKYWQEALIAIVVLSVSAFFVMYGLARWQKFSTETSFKGSINLVMMSEFGLVAGAVAVENGLLTAGILGYMTLIKLITNGYAVYLIQYNDNIYRYFKPYLGESETNDEDENEKEFAVVLGSSELDETIEPVLDERYERVIVIEDNPHEMKKMEEDGEEFVFGTPRHPEVLEEAGIDEASVVISLEEDIELDTELAERFEDTGTEFIAVSDSKVKADKLRDSGALHVILKEDAVKSEIISQVNEK